MAKINIKQHDISDCGAACIASVSAYYRLRLPLARLRQFAATDKKGSNVSGLIQAMKRLGFEGKISRLRNVNQSRKTMNLLTF